MRTSEEVYTWIKKEESRKKILTILSLPLTARQISNKTGIPTARCSYIIKNFVDFGVMICMNPSAQNSRIYGLSKSGILFRKHCIPDCSEYMSVGLDWSIYGWACYNHRSAVIRMLNEPMQPSEIRRKIRHKLPQIRMSANNTRDVIRLLLERGIVEKSFVRKKAHPRYVLTDIGAKLQVLLVKAESII